MQNLFNYELPKMVRQNAVKLQPSVDLTQYKDKSKEQIFKITSDALKEAFGMFGDIDDEDEKELKETEDFQNIGTFQLSQAMSKL